MCHVLCLSAGIVQRGKVLIYVCRFLSEIPKRCIPAVSQCVHMSLHEYVCVCVCPEAISYSLTHSTNIQTGFKPQEDSEPKQADNISILSVCQSVTLSISQSFIHWLGATAMWRRQRWAHYLQTQTDVRPHTSTVILTTPKKWISSDINTIITPRLSYEKVLHAKHREIWQTQQL